MKYPAIIVIVFCTLACAACSPDPKEHLKRGSDYLAQKKYDAAIIELRTAVQADGQLVDARLKLADAYLVTGKGSEALPELVRAADLLPKDASVQVRAGALLLRAGRYSDAGARAEKAIALDPKNTDAYILNGNALAGLKELDNALAQFAKASETDATKPEPYIGIGAILATRNQLENAEESFRRAVEVAPKSVRAQLALANFYWATKQLPKAEVALKDTLAAEPQNLTANRAMSVLLMATGRAAEAERYLLAIEKSAPGAASTVAVAQYYAATGRTADARAALTRLAAHPDSYAEATVRLADLDLAAGDRAAAWRRTKEVLAKQPKDAGALLMSGNLLFGERKFTEALAAATAALASDPASARAHELAGQIHMANDRRSEAIKSFEAALQADRNSFAAAIALSRLHLQALALDKSRTYAEQARAMRPGSADAYALIARNHLARGEVALAKPIVDGLLKQAANLPAAHNLAAVLELVAKRPDAARASYERALKLDPADTEAVTGLVQIDYTAGRKTEALARVDAYLTRRGRDEEGLLFAARTYWATGDNKRAEALFLEALMRNPNRLATYAQLGELYRREKRLDEAVTQFERLREKDPKSPTASTMLGMIHEQRGDKAAAERDYQKALAIDSTAPIAANNLAWLYVSSNRQLEQAQQLAQTALQQLPDEPNVADTLGWIYVQRKLDTLAIPQLERSVRQLPQNPLMHYHLGVAYLRTGDVAKATQSLKRALSLDGNFEGAADARSTLASLGK